MILQSIRWRILAWNFGLLAATTTVLLVAFHRHERANAQQEVDLRLRQVMTLMMGPLNDIIPGLAGPRRQPEPRPDQPRDSQRPLQPGETQRVARAQASLQEIDTAGAWIFVLKSDGSVPYRSARAPQSEGLLEASKTAAADDDEPAGPGPKADITFSLEGQRLLIHRPPTGHLIVFGADQAKLEAALTSLAWSLFAAGFVLVLVGCAVGWFLAGRSLRPIDRIAASAEGIAAGDYGRKIDTDETESELGRLAVVLNDTFGKMNAAREHMAQFTADASHELRTPLTVILSDSQGALRQERSPEEYRATLETIKQAALRMKSISDALLELAHGDAGRPVVRDDCDLADLADEAVALLGRVAREQGATLVAELEGAPVKGDAARLSRVILNLSINAILHNAAGVTVTVSTRLKAGCAELVVADNGRGIAAEALPRIFERFHRADASRSRHTGGAGLGLAIVRQTVEAHGGTIDVTSVVGAGTTFTLRLPGV